MFKRIWISRMFILKMASSITVSIYAVVGYVDSVPKSVSG